MQQGYAKTIRRPNRDAAADLRAAANRNSRHLAAESVRERPDAARQHDCRADDNAPDSGTANAPTRAHPATSRSRRRAHDEPINLGRIIGCEFSRGEIERRPADHQSVPRFPLWQQRDECDIRGSKGHQPGAPLDHGAAHATSAYRSSATITTPHITNAMPQAYRANTMSSHVVHSAPACSAAASGTHDVPRAGPHQRRLVAVGRRIDAEMIRARGCLNGLKLKNRLPLRSRLIVQVKVATRRFRIGGMSMRPSCRAASGCPFISGTSFLPTWQKSEPRNDCSLAHCADAKSFHPSSCRRLRYSITSRTDRSCSAISLGMLMPVASSSSITTSASSSESVPSSSRRRLSNPIASGFTPSSLPIRSRRTQSK